MKLINGNQITYVNIITLARDKMDQILGPKLCRQGIDDPQILALQTEEVTVTVPLFYQKKK